SCAMARRACWCRLWMRPRSRAPSMTYSRIRIAHTSSALPAACTRSRRSRRNRRRAATPCSIAPRLSTPRHRRLLFWAKIVSAIAVVVAVAYALVREWQPVTAAMHEARPRWGMLALSGAIVLANYALLIEAWRVVLAGWEGERRGADAP